LGAAAVVAVAALLLPAPFPPSNVEDRLRYCGIVFELCGLYIVFSGIENRLKLFADKGVVARALDWFRRFPRLHPRQIRMSAEGRAGGIGKAMGHLSTWRPIRAEASVEERLKTLEINLTNLKSNFEDEARGQREVVRDLAAAASRERKERETITTDLVAKLRSLGTSGVTVEISGLLWVFAGTIYANAPGEVACITGRLLGLP
jgi:hypothetical protein